MIKVNLTDCHAVCWCARHLAKRLAFYQSACHCSGILRLAPSERTRGGRSPVVVDSAVPQSPAELLALSDAELDELLRSLTDAELDDLWAEVLESKGDRALFSGLAHKVTGERFRRVAR